MSLVDSSNIGKTLFIFHDYVLFHLNRKKIKEYEGVVHECEFSRIQLE